MGKHRIILSPGHGGINPATGKYVTSGKRSFHPVDGAVYYEGVENRLIAKEWAKILRNNGYEVVFTVDPDDFRDVSLSERVRIANKFHAEKPSLLFPIHSNGVTSPHAHGHEVFTSPGETNSDHLAKFWIQEFESSFPDIHIRKDLTDGFPDKEANFTEIIQTHCPAVYLELLFHTNDKEVRILRDWKFRLQTGLAMVRAIKSYERWSK
jgi:N-acetylmuramoyl-L-alanine amidase